MAPALPLPALHAYGLRMYEILQQVGTQFLLQVLAAHLLHEASKGETSFWWPYLRSLPRSYTTAMCFTPDAKEALQVRLPALGCESSSVF